jgi:hypothetical protein
MIYHLFQILGKLTALPSVLNAWEGLFPYNQKN